MLLEGQVKILGREPGVSLKLEEEFGTTDLNVGSVSLQWWSSSSSTWLSLSDCEFLWGREVLSFLSPESVK